MTDNGKNGAITGVSSPGDRETVTSTYRKLMDGQDLSRSEKAALKRHEKDKEERTRWQYYAAIPQKHWRQMSGRQTKVINEQASRYGIPFGGANVNLPAVVRCLHDFLADNAVRLSQEEDELMTGSSSPALERYREERAAMARLDRLERERELVQRDLVRQSLSQVATILRQAGDTLQTQFGQAAADIMNEAIDDAEREVGRFFAGTSPELRETSQPKV